VRAKEKLQLTQNIHHVHSRSEFHASIKASERGMIYIRPEWIDFESDEISLPIYRRAYIRPLGADAKRLQSN
jgi:hypothetical protein